MHIYNDIHLLCTKIATGSMRIKKCMDSSQTIAAGKNIYPSRHGTLYRTQSAFKCHIDATWAHKN